MAGPIRIAILASAVQAKKEFVETERSAKKMANGIEKSGDSLGAKLGKNLRSSLTDSFASIAETFPSTLGKLGSSPPAVAAMAAVGTSLATVAGAAITAGLSIAMGGAVLGLGAIALRNSKPVKKAFGDLTGTISKTLADAAKPLEGPFTKGLQALSGIVTDLKPKFTGIFKDAAPLVAPLVKGVGDLAQGLVGGIGKAMPGIAAGFAAFTKNLGSLGNAIGGVFAEVFKNADLVGRVTDLLTRGIIAVIPAVGKVVHGLTVGFGAIANVVLLIRDDFKGFSDALAGSGVLTSAIDNIGKAFGPVKTAIEAVGTALGVFAAADSNAERIKGIQDLVKRIQDLWTALKPFFKTVFDEAWVLVMAVWKDKVEPWITGTVIPFLETQLKEKSGQIFADLVDLAQKKLSELPGKAAAALVNLGQQVLKPFTDAKDSASKKVGDLVSDAVSKLTGLPGKAGAAVSTLWAKMSDAFSTAKKNASDKAGDIVSGAVDKLQTLPGKAGDALKGIKTAVTDKFSGAGGWLADAGAKIIQGLVDGIKSRFGNISKAMGDAANLARSFWPFSPAKRGPLKSHPMNKAGQNIIADLAGGMGNTSGLGKAVGAAAQTVRDFWPFSPAKTGPLKSHPMRKAGQNVVRDLVAGMQDTSGLSSAMAGAAQIVANGPSVGSVGSAASLVSGQTVINFNSVVGDPVAVGKEVERVLNRYRTSNGRQKVA